MNNIKETAEQIFNIFNCSDLSMYVKNDGEPDVQDGPLTLPSIKMLCTIHVQGIIDELDNIRKAQIMNFRPSASDVVKQRISFYQSVKEYIEKEL